jgi:rhodanese-related sulfurtransferase
VAAALLGVFVGLPAAAAAWGRYGGLAGVLAPTAVAARLSAGDGLLVDLRPDDARSAAGVPDLRLDARGRGVALPPPSIPRARARALRSAPDFDDAVLGILLANLAKAGRSTPLFILDGGDGRAPRAARAARLAGVRSPYVVDGGFPAWRAAGLPLRNDVTDYGATPGDALADAADRAAAGLAAATGGAASARASPATKVGVVAGLAAAAVAAANWRFSLELVGVLGLFVSFSTRLLSYDTPDALAAEAAGAVAAARGAAAAVSGAAAKIKIGGGEGESED